ncbi:MAG: hypothetical protein QJR04_25080 [Burkholderia multivorans]|nr:hypothetical protein [Burkholderia multivorans]
MIVQRLPMKQRAARLYRRYQPVIDWAGVVAFGVFLAYMAARGIA